MENKRFDLTKFFDLYEQQTGEPLPGEAKRLIRKFTEQAAMFRNWGRWDRRSGFDPIAYDQTLNHVEHYLTGPRALYTGAMPVFTEQLARAMAEIYMAGYTSAEADHCNETM